MSFEKQNHLPEAQDISHLKQERIEKDFDAVLKAYQKMDTSEQKNFIDGLRSADPKFEALFQELRTFLVSNIKKIDIETHLDTLSSQKWKEIENIDEDIWSSPEPIETNFDSLLPETFENHLSNIPEMKAFAPYLEKKTVEWSEVVIFQTRLLSGISRFEDNKEPLALWLAHEEILQLEKLRSERLQATSNMPSAPENQYEAKRQVEIMYQKEYDAILQKYIPLAEKMYAFSQTDIWLQILSQTWYFVMDATLKQNIKKTLGYSLDTQNQTTEFLENRSKELMMTLSLNDQTRSEKIQSMKEDTNTSPRAKERLIQNMRNQHEVKIQNYMSGYAKDVWLSLIESQNSIVKEKGVFFLPLWNGSQVKLDFWSLEWKTPEEQKASFLKNFDDMYRNSLAEDISDYLKEIWLSIKNNPGKTLIDVSSVVLAWMWAVLLSQGTFGAWIPVAWASFTLIDNAYKAWMYEAFDIEGGWEKAMGFQDHESGDERLFKKLFELWGNTLLFWLFRTGRFVDEKLLAKFFTESEMKTLSFQLKRGFTELNVESWFFTYYSVVYENLYSGIQNDANAKELVNSFTKIPDMNTLLKAYMYNMWFIAAVKAWTIPVEKWVILHLTKQYDDALQKLEKDGYKIVDTGNWPAFFKGLIHEKDISKKELQDFIVISEKISHIASSEEYRKPESGRGGKTLFVSDAREAKFQRLEEYSREAQVWKIEYVFWDKKISPVLEAWGIQSGKSVWEWLLHKAGFGKDEIQDFKDGKLSATQKNEVVAIKEMNKAMEVVYKEYLEGYKKINSWIPLSQVFPGLSSTLIQKLEKVYLMDYNMKPKEKWEI